jgi:hypothetical protein
MIMVDEGRKLHVFHFLHPFVIIGIAIARRVRRRASMAGNHGRILPFFDGNDTQRPVGSQRWFGREPSSNHRHDHFPAACG